MLTSEISPDKVQLLSTYTLCFFQAGTAFMQWLALVHGSGFYSYYNICRIAQDETMNIHSVTLSY